MNDDQTNLVDDGLLTVEAAAEFLSVSRSTLYAEMDGGRLPYCKIGRSRRIPRRALVEFAADHLTGGWAMARHPASRAASQPATVKVFANGESHDVATVDGRD